MKKKRMTSMHWMLSFISFNEHALGYGSRGAGADAAAAAAETQAMDAARSSCTTMGEVSERETQ